MANQSDLQSYIQQLAGTHTAGQANPSSAVNNGNPNTVYNVKPNIPVSNAYDQWRLPQAPINWQQMSMDQGGVAGIGGGFFPNGGPGPITPPPVSWGFPPPKPPVGGGTPGHPNTGGPLPHTPVPPGGNQGHAGWGDSGNWRGGGGLRLLDLPPGSMGIYDKPTAGASDLSKSLSDAAGWGGLSVNDISGILGTSLNLGAAGQNFANTSLGRALGIKSDGSLSIGEVLDWVVPGNVYMAQTGKLNLLNAIPGILSRINPALGMAATAVMKWLATHTHIKALQNWLKRNQDNKNAGHGGGGIEQPGGGGHGQTGGGVIGGTWGWGGGIPGGTGNASVEIGNIYGGTTGNPMPMFDFHKSDIK